MSNPFKKAERKRVKLKIAITGPSGSGKTYSALRIATGLGGKIAVIDTENGSASLYSDKFKFDVLELTPPFVTEKYNEAIRLAVEAGFDVLIIDSITHAWAGEGGLLEQKEQLDARGRGNSYTNWGSITKKHESFKSSLLHSDIHLIVTMRSKQDYALVEKEGKQTPQKMGLAPIQREGMEYEFTTVFDVAMNHEAASSKDRTNLFDGKILKLSEQTGKAFLDWLSTGKEVDPIVVPEEKPSPPTENSKPASVGPTDKQLKRLHAIASGSKYPNETVKELIRARYSVESSKDLSRIQYDELCKFLEDNPYKKDAIPQFDSNEEIPF